MSTSLLPTAHPHYAHWGRGWVSTPRFLVAEARPAVQAVFLMRLAAGADFVRHPRLAELAALLGWVFITIAIYVFNGVTDMMADRANGSTRPIASGRLTASQARRWYRAIALAGLGLCLLVGPVEFGLGAAMLLLGWAYSAGPSLKDSALGFAAVIGGGAALTYTAGWVASGGLTVHDLVTTLSISVWVALCCASKDFSDVEGDRLAGRHTWPVLLGYERAARLLSVLVVAAAGCMLLSAFGTGANVLPAATLGVGSLAVAVSALRSSPNDDRTERRRPYRAYMLTQYATNAALLIFVAA